MLTVEDETSNFELKATDTTDGKTSRFESDDAELFKTMHHDHITGKLRVTIDGKQFTGDLHLHGHGHSHAGHKHEGDDALVWEREDIKLGALMIALGHHGTHLHAGESVEPAVSITREGKPVSDAKVFNSLWSADGKKELAKEVATVYEPPTEEEPAHFAQGELKIPTDVKEVIIRFRIVPSAETEETYDVMVPIE